jgi:hypothetical protein
LSNIEGHFPVSEIINQIEYDFSELQIDVANLYSICLTEMRMFGDLVTIPSYGFLHIQNRIGHLPKDFRSLISAVVVEPDECHAPKEIDRFITSRYWIEREEYGWQNANERACCANSLDVCQDTCSCNVERKIVERLYYKDMGIGVAYSYKNPMPLVLTRNTRNSNIISKDCENLKVYSSEFEVSIYNNKMETNFNKGTIFMRYNALPIDDEGVPLIPNGKTDAIRKYMEKRLMIAVLEDPKLLKQTNEYSRMFYSIFKQELPILRDQAMADLKHIQFDSIQRAVAHNRHITEKHGTAFKYL